jgi:hypothetical protein
MVRYILSLATAVCLTLTICFLFFGSQVYQDCVSEKQQKENTQTSNEKIPNFPVVIAYRDCFGRITNENSGEIVAIATGFIAAFTVVLACMARRQIKDTRILERAFIAVIPKGVRPFHAAGNEADNNIACNVIFKNIGHLAARSASFAVRYKFSDSASLKDGEFNLPPDSCVGNFVCPEGIEIIKRADPAPTKTEFWSHFDSERGKPSHWLYVYGRVEYRDGFEKDRWMNFCFRYSMAAADGFHRIRKREARYHEYGNHTDEG